MAPSRYADVTWDWDNPAQPCEVCKGRGWVHEEDASGAPRRQVACPYCGGRRNNVWVGERREVRHRANNSNKWAGIAIVGVLTGLLFKNTHWAWWSASDAATALLIGLWVALGVAWVVVLTIPKLPENWPGKAERRSRHAPGFTTRREAMSAAALAAAIGLKGGWEHRHDR